VSGATGMKRERLVGQLRALKMPGALREYEALASRARQQGWTAEEYLSEVLGAEQSSRHESAVRHRLREARFPEVKTLDSFDFASAESIDPAQINALAQCDFIDRAENILLAGPIGTGKTHIAIAIGVEAVRNRRRVLFARAADLVRSLIEARDARELSRMHRRLHSVELLICDEFGFVPFERAGGELLFNLVAERYERGSILLTTNLTFAEWPKILGNDEKLTTALLDRLAHHATVITTRGRSYRMRGRAQPAASSPSTAPPTAARPR